MRPVDPALLRIVPEARRPLGLLVATGVAAGAATIGTAFALTGVIVALVRGDGLGMPLGWLVGLFVLRGALAAASETVAARAGAQVSAALRTRLLSTRVGQRPVGGGARSLTLATSGCASVEPYVARFLPALVSTAVLPVAAVGALLVVDWLSALIVVLTLPLLPVFAALIGKTTQEETDRRWRALADLSGHFLDVVRGLPTLINYGRAGHQLDAIGRVSGRHRVATMRTLRTAFLSSAALELLATVSVAIVAVVCGIRLAEGHMALSTALLAILLAPEAYWPIRRVGQEFHNAADGAAALAEIRASLDSTGAQASPAAPDAHPAPTGPALAKARLAGVGYCYPGAAEPVLAGLDAEVGAGLTVVTGPSGVGKTTLLELIAGLRRPDTGTVTAPPCHLVTQRPFLPTGRLSWLLALGNDAGPQAQWAALREVGLDGIVAALPDGLETVIGDDGVGLSTGQRSRIALARALLAPESVILLDEPTAHLDADAAALAAAAIDRLAERACVIAVTHRPELLANAAHHLHLAPTHRAPVAVASDTTPPRASALNASTRDAEHPETTSSRGGPGPGVATRPERRSPS